VIFFWINSVLPKVLHQQMGYQTREGATIFAGNRDGFSFDRWS
jgi:hypothetical protein